MAEKHRWRVYVTVPMEVSIEVEGDDEDTAVDAALRQAQDWLDTLVGDHCGVSTTMILALDGRGPDEVHDLGVTDT